MFPKGPPRRLRETNRNELGGCLFVCLALLFGMRASNFYLLVFLFWFWGGRVDFEDGDAPFADFKTASELENVGGKNEERICGLLGRCTAVSANRKKMAEIWGGLLLHFDLVYICGTHHLCMCTYSNVCM